MNRDSKRKIKITRKKDKLLMKLDLYNILITYSTKNKFII